jgi:hypothetical protein
MQGKAIYGQIPQSEVERLGPQLEIDTVYTIRKFTVRVSKTSYVPFDADLMLQLTSFTTTTPSKVPADAFPKLIYNITPLKNIKTTGEAATKYIGSSSYFLAHSLSIAIQSNVFSNSVVKKKKRILKFIM